MTADGTESADGTEKMLRLLLRASGLVLMLALPAALLPTGWMDGIHRRLIGAPLPVAPITEYLTRSLSLLYATLGVVTWFLATDVRRYAPVIVCKSVAGMLFAVAVTALDAWAGLPWYWTAAEGPGIFVICVAGWVLGRQLDKPVR